MNGDITAQCATAALELELAPSVCNEAPVRMAVANRTRLHRVTRWQVTCRRALLAVLLLTGVTVGCASVSSAAPSRSSSARSHDAPQRGLSPSPPGAARSDTHNAASQTAPKYDGYSICTDESGLKIAQGRTQVVSGIAYVTIIFVNAGTANCYLNGTPFTQPVGATYTPVGPPAAAYFDPSRGGYVVLDAGGGTASTSLGIANAGKYFPRASCTPKKMIGVTLRFAYPADFFFRVGAGPIAVCRKITTTSITGVARGVVLGP